MVDLNFLKALIQMVKAEGLPRFSLKSDGVEVVFEAPHQGVPTSTPEAYEPDVLNDPYTFGGPSSGIPTFHRYGE